MPKTDERSGKILAVFTDKNNARKFTNSSNLDDGAQEDASRGSLKFDFTEGMQF